MASLDGLSEVILFVEDIDRMYEFYTEGLGLSVSRGDPEHGFVALETGACELCLHAGGEGSTPELATKVVFSVESLPDVWSTLLDRGIEMDPIRDGGPETRVSDGRDPEGNPFAIEGPPSH